MVNNTSPDPDTHADRTGSWLPVRDTEDLTEQAVIVDDEYAPRLRPFPARPSREAAGPDVYPLF